MPTASQPSADVPDLVDANVWLPLAVSSHAHHARSRHYWESEAPGQVAFCRVTMMALLRLVSDRRIYGDAAVDGAGAWGAFQAWLSHPNVVMLGEPDGIDELLARWAGHLDTRGPDWTDAYIAAFATASGARLVSFDAGFDRYPGLSWLHLED